MVPCPATSPARCPAAVVVEDVAGPEGGPACGGVVGEDRLSARTHGVALAGMPYVVVTAAAPAARPLRPPRAPTRRRWRRPPRRCRTFTPAPPARRWRRGAAPRGEGQIDPVDLVEPADDRQVERLAAGSRPTAAGPRSCRKRPAPPGRWMSTRSRALDCGPGTVRPVPARAPRRVRPRSTVSPAPSRRVTSRCGRLVADAVGGQV